VAKTSKSTFDPEAFLGKADGGVTITKYKKGQVVFTQGDPADSVFYIREGRVKRSRFCPGKVRKQSLRSSKPAWQIKCLSKAGVLPGFRPAGNATMFRIVPPAAMTGVKKVMHDLSETKHPAVFCCPNGECFSRQRPGSLTSPR
jgi:hypothetical protein